MRELAKSREGTIVLLELGKVLLRASELVALLSEPLLGVVQGEYPGRYLVVADENGQNLWEADAALRLASESRGQSLAVAWRPEGAAALP
jgi:hypothetical protein